MAFLKFRIYWEEDDAIYRDVVVKHTQNFTELNDIILKAFEFDQKHDATFFRSNDIWKRGREISKAVYEKEYVAPPLLMEETTIGSEIIDTNQHFIFLYDFIKSWTFLIELIQVIKNADADIFMEVWWCGSGCNGNTVNVVFGHKNYAEQATDNSEEWVKVVEKYNEMFGDDAYEEDIQTFETSLEMYGRSSYSMSFQPEMSSPENMSSLEELNTNN